jgi:hypothetical protein
MNMLLGIRSLTPMAARLWPALLVVLVPLHLAWVAATLLAPRFEAVIPSQDITHDSGQGYWASVNFDGAGLYVLPKDTPTGPLASRLTLFENGRKLGPPHSLHADIRESAAGRFSHWGAAVLFSASDGSDPRTNGRTYTFSSITTLYPGWAIGLGVLDLLVLLALRKRLVQLRRELTTIVVKYLQRLGWGCTARPELTTPISVCFATALLITGATFLFAWHVAFEYRTNDDVLMRFTAEGVIGDNQFSEFLFFQNVLVGLALRALYHFSPSFPWYDIALAAGSAAGMVLCQTFVYRQCRSWSEIAFCAFISILFFTALLQSLQFTASAILLSGGALLCLISIIHNPPASRAHLRVASAVVAVALVSGALVRFEAAVLAIVAILPIGLFSIASRTSRLSLAPIAGLGAGVLLAVATGAYDRAYFAHTPGWEDVRYEGTQRARATEYGFLDKTDATQLQTALTAAQWTLNDYEMVSGWLFADRRVFSADRMKRFADLMPRQTLLSRATSAFRLLWEPESMLGMTGGLCLAAAALRRSRRAFIIAGVSVLVLAGVLAACMIVFKPGLQHIIWPLAAMIAFAASAATFSLRSGTRSFDAGAILEDRVIGVVVLSGVLIVAGLQLKDILIKGEETGQLRLKIARDLSQWPLRTGDVVVVWDHNFLFERWVLPFRKMPSAPWLIFPTNVISATPIAEQFYRTWRSKDIAWSMCHIPGIYRVDAHLGYAAPHERIVKTHMHEHYGEAVDIVRAFEGEVLSLYTCKMVSAAGTQAP